MKMIRGVNPTEHQIQCGVIEWCGWTRYRDSKVIDFILAIPNGGYRNKIEAARLKSEGVKPGVSDLFLAIPKMLTNGDFRKCGMWMEAKTKTGKVSKKQAAWGRLMRNSGYVYVEFRSVDEGIQAIKNYLGIV